MDSRGLSQSELARRVGVSPTTIWKLASEPAQGSKHTHKIAFELGTTAAYLMDETDDPKSDAPDDHLSSEERAWIELLRNLDEKDRSAVLHITRSMVRSDITPTVHSPARRYMAK